MKILLKNACKIFLKLNRKNYGKNQILNQLKLNIDQFGIQSLIFQKNIVSLVRILNSSIFLKALSKVFSIPKIMPDPYFTGGGLNVTEKGGLLDVHVDGNYHDASGLNRRLNILLYFNPGWKKSWGGEFGIYSDGGKRCVKK
jgi:Rps23 Pro-64 3,4-dihydroxylase Tpa1-like proline 4-hydroxylase